MARTSAAGFELSSAGVAGRFRLSGAFGFETAGLVLERGDREFAAHPSVEVDLSGVTHADSAGLAVLLVWVERARKRGHRIRYVGLPQQLVGIAKITEIDTLLHLAE
jgi:phospholipid transport system transporter-binding protein